MNTVDDGIKFVFRPRSPAEILKTAVGRVVVFMQTFHAMWAWADKSFQHKSVDVILRAPGERYAGVGAWCAKPRRENATPVEASGDNAIQRSDPTSVGYLV